MLYEVVGETLPSLVDSGRDDGRDRVLYEVVGEHSLHLSTVGEMIVRTGCYIRLWGNTPFTCRQWKR